MCELLTGGAIAIFAFALATARDVLMRRRDERGRQRAALAGFIEEMLGNYRAAENNLNLLGYEQRSRKNREMAGLVNPLSQLENGAWAIARVDLPSELLKDQDLMQRLRQVHRNTTEVNGLIASRENFRLQHLDRAQPVLDRGLDGYAGILMHKQRDLKRRIAEAALELRPFQRGDLALPEAEFAAAREDEFPEAGAEDETRSGEPRPPENR